jgi:hypothetical protein
MQVVPILVHVKVLYVQYRVDMWGRNYSRPSVGNQSRHMCGTRMYGVEQTICGNQIIHLWEARADICGEPD